MSLPPGLALNPLTGQISGTPTTPGTYNFSLRVRDSQGSQRDIPSTITIAAYQPPSLSGTLAQFMTRSVAYSSGLTLAGGTPPVVWSIASGSLPAGVTINTSTGVISGTPTDTSYGTLNITVRVVDASGSSAQSAQVIQYQNTLTLTGSLAPATINQSYSSSFSRSGGHAPFTYALTAGSLPTGLSLNTSTGVISGVPTQGGNFSVTVRVTGASGATATASGSIAVSANTVPGQVVITGVNQQSHPGGTGPYGDSFQVLFSAPSDGGSPITGYQYLYTGGGVTVSGSISGPNGVVTLPAASSPANSSQFFVTASNAVGSGQQSAGFGFNTNYAFDSTFGGSIPRLPDIVLADSLQFEFSSSARTWIRWIKNGSVIQDDFQDMLIHTGAFGFGAISMRLTGDGPAADGVWGSTDRTNSLTVDGQSFTVEYAFSSDLNTVIASATFTMVRGF